MKNELFYELNNEELYGIGGGISYNTFGATALFVAGCMAACAGPVGFGVGVALGFGAWIYSMENP